MCERVRESESGCVRGSECVIGSESECVRVSVRESESECVRE